MVSGEGEGVRGREAGRREAAATGGDGRRVCGGRGARRGGDGGGGLGGRGRGGGGGGFEGVWVGGGGGVGRGEFDIGMIPGDELEGEDGEDERGGKAEPFGVGGRLDFAFPCGQHVSLRGSLSIGEGFADDGGVNLLFSRDKSERKRAERNCVYFTGYAAAGLSDEGNGFGGEDTLISAAGSRQAMLDVVSDFDGRERLDVGERGDALAKLLERG